MGHVTESIFSNKNITIPMADVQHIEKLYHSCDLANGIKEGDLRGGQIITKHTKWSHEIDYWENNIWLSAQELNDFLEAWCYYRYELEKDTLAEMP